VAAEVQTAPTAVRVRAPRRQSVYVGAARELRKDPFAMAALVVLALVLIAAVAGPVIMPADPLDQSLRDRLKPPVWQAGGTTAHLFGTDQLGRDIFSRMIDGARVSVMIGVLIVLISSAVGTTLGLLAGYVGGRLEIVIGTLTDVILSFPGLLMALTIVTVLSPSMGTLILALSIRGWVVYARVSRGQTLALSQFQYIEAARTIGASTPRILAGHLLPNLLPSIMTIAILELARMILAESSLSFIGLGVQAPQVSWGLMLAEGREYMLTANWLVTLPGVAIALTVLSFNILSSHIRRVVDPFQRGRVDTSQR
jgi:ABC-type dipeptide/oligopeptide/nickel transport system permease subunit